MQRSHGKWGHGDRRYGANNNCRAQPEETEGHECNDDPYPNYCEHIDGQANYALNWYERKANRQEERECSNDGNRKGRIRDLIPVEACNDGEHECAPQRTNKYEKVQNIELQTSENNCNR